MMINVKCCYGEKKIRASKWGWGCVAPIQGSCSEATLAVRLGLEEGSHENFWVKNLGRGNCAQVLRWDKEQLKGQ